MRYFKFALAAGASIVVAARLSPAYALPPVYPLDANGPIRQGNMCIAPSHAHWAEISTDTGPGYSYFYECGRHKRAHRETHTAHAYTGAAPWAPSYHHLDLNGPIRQGRWCIAPSHAHWAEISLDTGPGYGYFYECGRHKRAHRETHTAHGYTGAAPWAPSYHHLDLNGPIRQGRWCIAPSHAHWAEISLDTGPGYGYFYECAPAWAVGDHHHRHAHHARHHYRKHHHGHHRHALHPDSPVVHERSGMILSHAGGSDSYAIEQGQQSWQTIAVADVIDAVVYNSVSSDGGIDLANENVTETGDSDVIIGNDDNDRLQGDGGLPGQLVAADNRPVVSLEWIRIAAGAQISHSMTRREIGERIVKVPFGSDQRHAPFDPALPVLSALGQRSPQLQLRREDIDAGQKALTRGDYSNPVRSEAGGGTVVSTTENGYSPIAAVLGLVLALATPITLVATQVPVVDKAAVIDTVSDPIAETAWYVPIGNS